MLISLCYLPHDASDLDRRHRLCAHLVRRIPEGDGGERRAAVFGLDSAGICNSVLRTSQRPSARSVAVSLKIVRGPLTMTQPSPKAVCTLHLWSGISRRLTPLFGS